MPNYRLDKSASAAVEWSSHATNICNFLESNPGTTRAAIAAGLTIDVDIVDRVLASIERAGGLYRGYDTVGVEELYGPAEMGALICSKLADARVWVDANDGGSVDAMAVSLGVTEAVAIKLAHVLAAESDVKITAL